MPVNRVGSNAPKAEGQNSEHVRKRDINFVRKIKGTMGKMVKSLEKIDLFSKKLSAQSKEQRSHSSQQGKYVGLPLERGLKRLHKSISLAIEKVVQFIQKRLQPHLDLENKGHFKQNIEDLKSWSKQVKARCELNKSEFRGLEGLTKSQAQADLLKKSEDRKEISGLCDKLRGDLKKLSHEISGTLDESGDSGRSGSRNFSEEIRQARDKLFSAEMILMRFDKDIENRFAMRN